MKESTEIRRCEFVNIISNQMNVSDSTVIIKMIYSLNKDVHL